MLCQLFTAFNIIVTGRLCSVLFKNIAIIDVTYIGLLVFTARCYASAVLATALCPSVCLSVRPSRVGVLLKRLNVGSHSKTTR